MIYHGACKKEYLLPLIKDEDDAWYCNRLINEALIKLTQHNPGPVHLNIPLSGDTNALINATKAGINCQRNHRLINYYTSTKKQFWSILPDLLQKSNRILIVMGQMSNISEKLRNNLDRFFSRYNCPLLADNLANYKNNQLIQAEAIIKALNSKTIEKLLPQIVITFGYNFQERIKYLFINKNK